MPRPYSRITALLAALLVCSLALDLVLYARIMTLQRILRTMTESSNVSRAPALSAGDWAPAVEGVERDGSPVVIEMANTALPTLLYAFSPTCPFCTRNLDNVSALAVHSAGRYRMIGIALDEVGLDEYLRQTHISIPVITRPSRATRSAYNLNATPITILVSRTGRVERVWRGAFREDIAADVGRVLGLTVPGLRAPGTDALSPQR